MELIDVLPPDWEARIAGHHPRGVTAPLLEYLQRIAGHLGGNSVLVRHVQDLAHIVCSPIPTPVFEPYERVFSRLVAKAAGDWPLHAPFTEPGRSITSKTSLNLLRDLDAIEAEWLVLDKLVEEGWTPIERDRADGDPDWFVEKNGVVLPVEVKHKKLPSYFPDLAASLLAGIGMLPDATFLTRHRWAWDLPPDCRDNDVFRIACALWAQLEDTRTILESGLPIGSAAVPLSLGPRYDLYAETGFREGAFLAEGVVFRLKRKKPPGALRLESKPASDYLQGVWVPGGVFGTCQRRYDATVEDDLRLVLGRLAIDEQVERRHPDCLVVVAWFVAPEMIAHFDLGWLSEFWERFTAAKGWPRAVLWPIGSFEVTNAPWIANTGAAAVLNGP